MSQHALVWRMGHPAGQGAGLMVVMGNEFFSHHSNGTIDSHTVRVAGGPAEAEALRMTRVYEDRGYEMWVPPTEVATPDGFDPRDVDAVAALLNEAGLVNTRA